MEGGGSAKMGSRCGVKSSKQQAWQGRIIVRMSRRTTDKGPRGEVFFARRRNRYIQRQKPRKEFVKPLGPAMGEGCGESEEQSEVETGGRSEKGAFQPALSGLLPLGGSPKVSQQGQHSTCRGSPHQLAGGCS